MQVKDCMSKNICYCNTEDLVASAAKLMCENHIGCIPVCDQNKYVVGILTDRDIILRSIACDKDVKQTPVTEIMTTNVCCCNTDTSLQEAAKLMQDMQVRRLPVLENNQIVVYGSPWNGKHHLGTNSCAPLKAIGIIHQSNENACVPLSKKDAYLPLFCQIYRPEDPVDLMNTMDFIQRIIDSVNIYDIYCMKDIEAARVSHKVMND